MTLYKESWLGKSSWTFQPPPRPFQSFQSFQLPQYPTPISEVESRQPRKCMSTPDFQAHPTPISSSLPEVFDLYSHPPGSTFVYFRSCSCTHSTTLYYRINSDPSAHSYARGIYRVGSFRISVPYHLCHLDTS